MTEKQVADMRLQIRRAIANLTTRHIAQHSVFDTAEKYLSDNLATLTARSEFNAMVKDELVRATEVLQERADSYEKETTAVRNA